MSIYNRIKKIREQTGMTQKELAEKAGINRSTLTQIENGKYKDLTISKVINISNALDISPSYLIEAQQKSPEERILFRAQERLNSESIPEISWFIHSLYPRYKALLSIIKKENPMGTIPCYNIPFDPISIRKKSIEFIAEKERKSLGLTPGKNYHLKSFLFRYADIFETPFSSLDILGFAILNESYDRPLIIVNSMINPNQKRFILAHEYGHLLFDREKISDRIELRENWYSTDQIEVRANQFAAEFLIPAKDLYLHADKVNESGLAFLMNEYGVSRQVIVNRWYDLKLIDDSQKEYFESIKPIQLMKIHGYINDEVKYYETKSATRDSFTNFNKLPTDYIQLVKEAYVMDKISYKKIADYCFIHSGEIEKKLELTKEKIDEYENTYE